MYGTRRTIVVEQFRSGYHASLRSKPEVKVFGLTHGAAIVKLWQQHREEVIAAVTQRGRERKEELAAAHERTVAALNEWAGQVAPNTIAYLEATQEPLHRMTHEDFVRQGVFFSRYLLCIGGRMCYREDSGEVMGRLLHNVHPSGVDTYRATLPEGWMEYGEKVLLHAFFNADWELQAFEAKVDFKIYLIVVNDN